ncbi:hypothetical protein [Mycobacterium lepromatosis]|uniref:hypothetical protein n=1 Tax=Mycobacterium lepromatosis TaxID=480418 RepID=UPI0005F8417B|nr:hypothetical protein [Mycobacterium lepromatosis]
MTTTAKVNALAISLPVHPASRRQLGAGVYDRDAVTVIVPGDAFCQGCLADGLREQVQCRFDRFEIVIARK